MVHQLGGNETLHDFILAVVRTLIIAYTGCLIVVLGYKCQRISGGRRRLSRPLRPIPSRYGSRKPRWDKYFSSASVTH
ncbi:hypothetical protein PUN28_019464 [Cardiocondyla obscurior]|uniref:Uncharacterized protein n=1 Tax=Cardiocondyla obscurior TaxID=286306 RepID=A0AAW2E9A8_9HYME